ncbi:Major intrinsic protein [Macleaya cordata]|uniref:Major intrinsic protein n=1 Tax=Macleaya cordata TaxID=56857 RepID=A0A200QSN0_MACCD|nr:Major intrinsic protein [Macleaya cordata]
MADDIISNNINGVHGNHANFMEEGVVVNFKSNEILPIVGDQNSPVDPNSAITSKSECMFSLPFFQKLFAEGIATYFLVFAGCAAVEANLSKNEVVTLPGIAVVFGLVLMIMIYTVGHISGGHLNPAVTIAFASCRKFPWKAVPSYVLAQVLGSILAIGTLRLLFVGKQDHHFLGNTPSGSNVQSLVLEFILTFFLMFVICGVATDNRAIGELAGLAIGSTVLVNIIYAGSISGGSMNPARSLAPAIVFNRYEGIWIYLVGPTCGAIAGAWTYNLIRFTNKPLPEITKSGSFLGSSGRNGSN